MHTTKIAFDTARRRPGCVLIQAALGGMNGARFHKLFPAETWLTDLGEGTMRLYQATDAELEKLSTIAKAAIA